MKEDWMSVGDNLVETMGGQDEVRLAAQGLHWLEVASKPELPFSQGYAINEIIKQFRLNAQKVAYFTTGRVTEGYGFYGVESKYSNGTARLYVVDDGCSVTPVLSVFEPSNG